MVNDPENDVTPLRYISWLRFEEDGFVPVKNYYVGNGNLYRICLDPFMEGLYMICDYQSGEVQFRSDYSDAAEQGGEPAAEGETEGPQEQESGAGEPAVQRSDLLFTLTVAPEKQELQPAPGEEIRITVGDLGKARGFTKQYIESLIERDG